MADELLTLNEAVAAFIHQLDEEIALQLKHLLEEKHLYQRVRVDPDQTTELLRRIVNNRQLKIDFRVAVQLNPASPIRRRHCRAGPDPISPGWNYAAKWGH